MRSQLLEIPLRVPKRLDDATAEKVCTEKGAQASDSQNPKESVAEEVVFNRLLRHQQHFQFRNLREFSS